VDSILFSSHHEIPRLILSCFNFLSQNVKLSESSSLGLKREPSRFDTDFCENEYSDWFESPHKENPQISDKKEKDNLKNLPENLENLPENLENLPENLESLPENPPNLVKTDTMWTIDMESESEAADEGNFLDDINLN
jgi:hypothetical protein